MCRKQGEENGGWESMQVGVGMWVFSWKMLGMQVGVQLVLGEWTVAGGMGNARHASGCATGFGGVDSSKWNGDKKRKEKKRKGHCLRPWFEPKNWGGKWAKLGLNWA